MTSESLTKSIVYGNHYKNDYGTFLPVCSAVGQRLHCDKILEYLRGNKFFARYQRYAYAYRVDEAPVVFITEKKNEQSKFVDGCHSDPTIDGAGDKLLHLLEKLSTAEIDVDIRNVFVAVLIDQKDPLKRFESTNYRAIVQNCRELLNTLYTKVIKAELKLAKKQPNLIIDSQKTLVLKKCQVDRQVDLPQPEKPIGYQRPNHIYSESKPAFLQRQSTRNSSVGSQVEIRFLKGRSRTFQEQFRKLQQSLQEKDFQHLKFMATYDRNPLVLQVLQLVQFAQDISYQQLPSFDFGKLAQWKLQPLQIKRFRRMSDLLISNRMLIVDNILKINKSLAVVFSLIDLLIRNSKAHQRIESLREQSRQPQPPTE